MAMLAEARRKQKWSNDPRNTNWTNDTSRFGYQMLTKMGWESGKGLGAKEDGATTHVKSVKRRDNLGLGADKSNEDNWLSHQLAFDDLLSTLNEHTENGTNKAENVGSKKAKKKHEMEKTARQSRKRVFYNRFIQSKDLSSKSAKDMACIFGQRSKSAPGTPQEQSEGEESDASTASCPPQVVHGVQTINSGQSIQEYFERKMRQMKAAREGREVEGRKKHTEQHTGDEVQENNTENQETADEESMRRKKKKSDKKRKRKVEADVGELGSDESGSNVSKDECSVRKKEKSALKMGAKSEEESESTGRETRREKRRSKKRKEKNMNAKDSDMCEFGEVQSETKEGSIREEKKYRKEKGKGKKNKDKVVSSVQETILFDKNERQKENSNLKQSKDSVEDESAINLSVRIPKK